MVILHRFVISVLLVGGHTLCNSGHGQLKSSRLPFLALGHPVGPAQTRTHEGTQAGGSANTPTTELCTATSCGHLPRAGFAGLGGVQQRVGSAQRCFGAFLFSLSVGVAS